MTTDQLPPLPDPDWYAIDTYGADVDITFVRTKGEALGFLDNESDFDDEDKVELCWSRDKVQSYARAAIEPWRARVAELEKERDEARRMLRNVTHVPAGATLDVASYLELIELRDMNKRLIETGDQR